MTHTYIAIDNDSLEVIGTGKTIDALWRDVDKYIPVGEPINIAVYKLDHEASFDEYNEMPAAFEPPFDCKPGRDYPGTLYPTV